MAVINKELIGIEREFILRLAKLQLNNPSEAEDAVQETLLGAIKNIHTFSGKVSIRSWLLGILRYKIIDAIRARKSEVIFNTYDDVDRVLSSDNYFFDEKGSWNMDTFSYQNNPENLASQQSLLDIVQLCLSRLSESSGRLLLQREYLGLDMKEIASQANISLATLRVQLFRSRLKLRECVVTSWGVK